MPLDEQRQWQALGVAPLSNGGVSGMAMAPTVAVEPVSFRDTPTRGALPEGRRRWQDYVPPAAGTPVLAITDLGIGGPPVHPARARAGEWADFAAQLDRRESALVALVPYPRSRWPRWVGRTLTAIPWDRTTTLSTALTALRWAGRPL